MENNETKRNCITQNIEHSLSEATRADFELLKECLKESEKAGVNVTLNKFGYGGVMELNDVTSVKVRNTIGIADNFIRLIVTFEDKGDFDIKQIRGIYNQYLRENTKDLSEGKDEALILTVELGKVKEKKNLYYSIKLFNPLICMVEDDKMIQMVFSMDNMNFGKFDVSYADILNEIEVENAE